MNRIINLKDIINVEAFQKIQDDIAKATGIAIITTDYKGKPITEHSCCTEFCNIVRLNKDLVELCEKCDSRGGIEATRTGEPYIYICHKGIVDFAVPIIVQGQYLGSIMAGQVLTEERDQSNLESVVPINFNIEENEMLISAYKRLPVIPLEKIKHIAQMMLHISKYIVEESMYKINEQKLSETNNKMIQSGINEIKFQKELEKSRLMLLSSQINQDFIFNILNSIYSLTLIENAKKTSEVTFKLSEFIRDTFEKSNKIVTLGEEINYSLSYLNLQKIRFGKRLNFNIEINSEDEKVKIPFMSMYPFVENVVKHGISSKEDGGYVTIKVEREKEFIRILIIDNGIGIAKEKLKYINQDINQNINFLFTGIESAKQRIRNFYKYDYLINIESEIKKGTKVIINLPKDDRWE
ncbi:PocR ligand-binding domain-containing protein [Clostridium uliginosum]|uniref:Histidine kinase-, DNA gyrase B-, and HSP90-like ATPase n=1 Tax=Clostridium uliginosum TaxID=119641 RepID=A0A1I1S317_9CLOT|nr:PocR ligand-binding domain-containing protein [Clostridium uliginosum]SFD40926.1 Histidine kinase-, DNA gyrase B-, and HSP90-like ATPase [Clostridium uliginosum]